MANLDDMHRFVKVAQFGARRFGGPE